MSVEARPFNSFGNAGDAPEHHQTFNEKYEQWLQQFEGMDPLQYRNYLRSNTVVEYSDYTVDAKCTVKVTMTGRSGKWEISITKNGESGREISGLDCFFLPEIEMRRIAKKIAKKKYKELKKQARSDRRNAIWFANPNGSVENWAHYVRYRRSPL